MRKEMIEMYMRQLRGSLGVRPPVPEKTLRNMHEKKDFAGMALYIRSTLRLGMRLRIGFVNKGGLADTDAWIYVPDSIPIYGTEAFSRTLVTMYIRKTFLCEAPFETVVLAMAHELCHVVLKAIRHELKVREEAVDLTAMMLGYRDFYRIGCEYIEPASAGRANREYAVFLRVHKTGYLTPEEVKYAAAIMDMDNSRGSGKNI